MFSVKQIEEPKDKLWLVYITFMFLGLVNFLPLFFIITCTSYWMYKFRDTTKETYDPSERTDLQALANSSFTIACSVTLPVFTFLVGTFGHLFDIKKRLIISNAGTISAFILFASFVYVNTDNWQFGFFCLTIITAALSQAFVCITTISGFTLISHFPQSYNDCYITSQGISSLLAAILQILALAVGMSPEMSALIYFGMAIGILVATLTLTLMSFNSKFFKHHMDMYHKVPEKEESLNLKEIFRIFKKISPTIITLIVFALTLIPTHTAITNLVVSEGEGNGNAWNDTYFVPTITFLLSSVCDLLGRVSAPYIPMGKVSLIIFAFLRLVYVPLIMLCNAQPRKHLSVIFNHDYQYILILATFQLTGGFVFSKANLNIAKLVNKDEVKRGYHILTVVLGVVLAVLSPLNAVSVKLL